MTQLPPRPVLHSLVAVVLALSALLAGPLSAEAATAVKVGAVAMPGRAVSLVGRGFVPGSILQARWDRATTRLRLISVDSRGRFTVKIRIPSSAKPGGHTVSLARVTRSQIAKYGGTGSTRLIPARTIIAPSILVLAVGAYGSRIGMDSLNNTEVGGPNNVTTTYRFRAAASETLDSIRVYVIGPTHAGYGAGTGGTWQVTVQTDDGSPRHLPSGTVLATTSFRPVDGFPVIAWPSPATLVAGHLYHVVFRNVDSNPRVNYASLDGVFMLQPTSPRQAAFSDVDWGQPMRSGTGPWMDRSNTVPIMQLNYGNGVAAGLGYMEVWVGSPKRISGTAKARESFTVSGAGRGISSVRVRLARISGSSPLTVRLETGDGTLIEQGVIPASQIAVGSRPTWATYIFSAPRALGARRSYNVVLSAPSDTAYSVFVIRKGLSWGFSPTTWFRDGRAQYNPGSGWGPFTQGDRQVDEGDLQFYFR